MKGKCCERRRRSRAQCLSACTGVVDFVDENDNFKIQRILSPDEILTGSLVTRKAIGDLPAISK